MASSNLISWPISPNEGQVYQSPLGDYWVFNNCMWVSTCCPNLCSYEDGVTLWVITDDPGNVKIKFEYVGLDTNGNPYFQSIIAQIENFNFNAIWVIKKEEDFWALYQYGDQDTSTVLIATSNNLYSETWTMEESEFDTIITLCGEEDKSICFNFTGSDKEDDLNITLLPIYEDINDNYPYAYFGLEDSLFCFFSGTEWEIGFFEECDFKVPGTIEEGPFGEYSIGSLCSPGPSFNTLIVSNDKCECTPGAFIKFFTNESLTNFLIINLNYDEESNSYVGDFNIEDEFTNITIAYVDEQEQWEILANNLPWGTSSSIFGLYQIEAPLENIYMIQVSCGNFTKEICLNIDGDFKTMLPVFSLDNPIGYTTISFNITESSTSGTYELRDNAGNLIATSTNLIDSSWVIEPAYSGIYSSISTEEDNCIFISSPQV